VSVRQLIPVDGTQPDWPRRVAAAVNALNTRPSDLVITSEGALTAGQRMLHFKLQRDLVINTTGHFGEASVAPTSNAVFNVKVAGSTIGTVTFAAGQTTATFSFTNYTVPALALFELTAPAPADPTLASVEILLSVTRN
jgi:hypothetical protein